MVLVYYIYQKGKSREDGFGFVMDATGADVTSERGGLLLGEGESLVGAVIYEDSGVGLDRQGDVEEVLADMKRGAVTHGLRAEYFLGAKEFIDAGNM